MPTLLILRAPHVPFVQANLIETADDDPSDGRAPGARGCSAHGVWANDPVPLYPVSELARLPPALGRAGRRAPGSARTRITSRSSSASATSRTRRRCRCRSWRPRAAGVTGAPSRAAHAPMRWAACGATRSSWRAGWRRAASKSCSPCSGRRPSRRSAREAARSRPARSIVTGLPLDWTARDAGATCARGDGAGCARARRRASTSCICTRRRCCGDARLAGAGRRGRAFLRRDLVARGARRRRCPRISPGARRRRGAGLRAADARDRAEPRFRRDAARGLCAGAADAASCITARRAAAAQRGRARARGAHGRAAVGRGQECRGARSRGGAARRAGARGRAGRRAERRGASASITCMLLGTLDEAALARGIRNAPRCSPRRRATSRSGSRCWKRRRPAWRWCCPTSRASASCGTAPRCSSIRTIADALRAALRRAARRSGRARSPDARARAGRGATRRRRWSTATLALHHAAARARRRRRLDDAHRLFHPFACLLLESRQRAFPARRAARADRARTRGRGVRAAQTAGAATNLLADHGDAGARRVRAPPIPSLQRERLRAGDRSRRGWSMARTLVIVHEWNEPALVAAIGRAARAQAGRFRCCSTTRTIARSAIPRRCARFDLSGYDGVLAFGEALAEVYRGWGWGERVFVWHEAADTRLFRPPARRGRARRASSGSATGATASAARSCEDFLLRAGGARRPAARRVRRALSRARRWRCLQRTARAIAAGSPTPRAPGGVRAASRDRARAAALLCDARCPASRRSACSRRWPAASRWSPRHGDCRGPVPPGRGFPDGARPARDGAASARRARTIRRCAHALAAHGLRDHPRAAHLRASRATSCSASATGSAHARSDGGLMRDRVLRIEPAVLLLERRRDLLSRPAVGAGAARPRDHLLRAGRLRPAGASRHRAAGLGARRRLSRDRGRRCAA